MPPKAAASNDLDMVKALADRLEELNATASMGGVRDSYREARDELRARNKQAWELKTALGAIGAAPVRLICAF